jgi:hypothetical protein
VFIFQLPAMSERRMEKLSVGWVELRETHHHKIVVMVGLVLLDPPYR